MRNFKFMKSLTFAFIALGVFYPQAQAVSAMQKHSSLRAVCLAAVKPSPRLPLNPLFQRKKENKTTVRYSSSASASNLLTPAILLGLPTLFIIFLLIMASKGD